MLNRKSIQSRNGKAFAQTTELLTALLRDDVDALSVYQYNAYLN